MVSSSWVTITSQLAIEVATFVQNAVKAGIFLPVLGGDVWSGRLFLPLIRAASSLAPLCLTGGQAAA